VFLCMRSVSLVQSSLMNTLDLTVLRALARLSRMRKVVDCESLALRAGGSLEEVRGALGRLSREQLVDRAGEARLTMAGLAVAVASGAAVTQRRSVRTARRRAA
jgi:RIO-like serine/threonine protein kinase